MESYFDKYDYWNFDSEVAKHLNTNRSGRGRSKLEATQHKNREDPSGHTRKLLVKFVNSSHNKVASPS